MRIRQILKLLLLTGFVSGCWFIHTKDEAPGSLGDIDLLQSFIGQKSESVVRELGLPNELLSDGDKQFMVYSAKSSDTSFLMIIWVPVVNVGAMEDSDNTLHCLRFELDSDNVVKEYRVKSRVMHTLILVFDIDLISSCREAFWSKQEREKLKPETIFRTTWQDIEKEKLTEREVKKAEKIAQELAKLELEANKGNVDAQLKLFQEIRATNPTEALRWLCKSADQGNQYARHILGSIYEHDGYIWVDRYFARQDYRLAYVWYSLGDQMDQEMLQFFADRHLNSEELSEAKSLLREWAPGQCERDLGLVSYTE
jgi:TPR repeat protein